MNRAGRILDRFRSNPASLRNATAAIISVTVGVVVLGAVLIWLLDRDEYPTFGEALWFTLQTVTTVGYGDATPERALGRIVAGVVMVTAIGLITIVTALITSVFIEAARAKLDRSKNDDEVDARARLEASLAEISGRLDRLESSLSSYRSSTGTPPDGS